MNFHDEFEHRFVDFTRERWTYETCDSIPFQSQLDSHPKLTPEISEQLKQIFFEDALRAIEVEACYFLFGQENQQVDKPTPAKDVDFPDEIYGNATDIVDEYLNSVKDYFSFLVGNNEYRTYSDRLMKHCCIRCLLSTAKNIETPFRSSTPPESLKNKTRCLRYSTRKKLRGWIVQTFTTPLCYLCRHQKKDVYEIPMFKRWSKKFVVVF